MKIGILTFHRAINYGAVLQCYALQETLKRMGHNVEVIDYRQPMIEKAYKCIKWNWLAKKIIKFWKLPGYLKVIIQNLKQTFCTDTARCTFTARFIDCKVKEESSNIDHTGGFIHNDQTA